MERFKFVSNHPFLDAPNNVGLALNIDWFNPYEHAQYSIGAIYLTILNLPREDRYTVENTILVGLMPGPSEPKRISPFLYPLVDDLLQLWEGVHVSLCLHLHYVQLFSVLFQTFQLQGRYVVSLVLELGSDALSA